MFYAATCNQGIHLQQNLKPKT